MTFLEVFLKDGMETLCTVCIISSVITNLEKLRASFGKAMEGQLRANEGLQAQREREDESG